MNMDAFITIATTSIITSSFNTVTTFFVYKFFLKRLDGERYDLDKNKRKGFKILSKSK